MTCENKPRYIITLSSDRVGEDNEVSFEIREHEGNTACKVCLAFASFDDFLEGLFATIIEKEEDPNTRREIIKALYYGFLDFVRSKDKYIFPRVPEDKQKIINELIEKMKHNYKK